MTIFVVDAPVAIDLATSRARIPSEHSLTAPTLLRSQVLALVYGSVQRGELEERSGRTILDGIRGLRIRLLGDRTLQDHAWRIAAELNWSDTYRAEYIALTRLQADALATADAELSSAAKGFVTTVSPAEILRA
ncbi:type II toxin-antitoxin system VapC family toxin [Mycobacterium sp. M26]|uniref:type II toxin-antitoxin system VapC family toxin n=1 Tax=Mycobacterium sp. M26 TaxID=1762962 RepID=UPI00073E1B1E|nr:type II toxin-antitoxin system VapC family toxin [Mycobacterium sp. M26]